MLDTEPLVAAVGEAPPMDLELSQIREQLMVLRAQNGDPVAFRRLVDQYERRLLYFIGQSVPDPNLALDIMQEVWLAVFRKLKKLRSPQAFRVWLYRIAHDRVVTSLRRSRREQDSLQTFADAVEQESNDEQIFDDAEMVHHALARLTVHHRVVLSLRFLEDMPVEEIADVLTCKTGTIKSRLYYAKRSLRKTLEKLVHE